jgi:type IV secretion system protein TrbL
MKSKRFSVYCFIAILLFAFDASAAISSNNILNNVTDQFHAQASAWAGIIIGYATWLFWTLGIISLVWTGGTLVLKRADIGEFFAEFIRFSIFFGFFLWLLQNAVPIGASIINSLIQIGANASQTGAANPSAVMDIGFQIFYKVMQQTSLWSPVASMTGAIVAGIILICIALIAANMTIMLCSAWILLYGGIFFLGFGGSRWTSEIAIHYYKTLLGVGASLMAMVLMIGIAQSIVTNYYNQMSVGIQVNEIATIMVVAIILLFLIHRVPGLISGIITGAGIGHSGIGTLGAGAAVGAASVAAAVTTTAGSMAGAAVNNIAGGGQAMKAAFQSAQQNLMSNREANSNGSNSSSGGLTAAMNTGKSFVADMGKSLAKGAGSVMKQSMNEGAADTFLGKVATNIKNETSGNASSQTSKMPNFIGGAKDSNVSSKADEIAAFVNKTA